MEKARSDGRFSEQSIVNVNKIKKRLRSEIKANPRKSAGLGVLFAVGSYFWVPLIWGWVAPEDDSARRKPSTATAGPAIPTAILSESPREKHSQPFEEHWRQIAKAIDDDPKMRPAALAPDRPSPFGPSSEPDGTKTSSDEDEAAMAAVTPESLGLMLSSTVVGETRRVALVNGRAYAEGSVIEIAKGLEFVLARVYSRHVVLERGGRQFDLVIASAERSSPPASTPTPVDAAQSGPDENAATADHSSESNEGASSNESAETD